ncbi:YfiR family protein [Agarivorans aestuarii]|uniref:YfiR family protein n=1 Tax=Agarivorans aestuarii TaxID=1563703 RepID=A0ABU7G943_9ALTE|nr:YfiR family protein [Agarivorans aestuarii]MEE1675871.1 YfiR family protein [Agarivorans aestuarii]
MFAIRRFVKLLITLAILGIASEVSAADKEAALKAGFMFNFARYSEWQGVAKPLGYFKLCSPDIEFVDTASWVLHKQRINELEIRVSLVELDSLAINQCNLLFVPTAFRQAWQNVDKSLLPHTMLVGETPDFIQQGGHIRFFLLAGKIRFEVAPAALKKADISMSSKVLRLSRVVKEEQ